MPDLQIISRAIDFIEANLTSSVTVADMAESTSYSLFHFCRVFNRTTHLTPYDYLIRRRLTESTHALAHSDRRILEVALDYQFNNPETFSRAFRRMFGILPSEFRKGSAINPHRLMPRWTDSHLQHSDQNPDLFPQVEKRDSMQMAGLMTLVHGDPSAILEVWERFLEELRSLTPRTLPKEFFSITYLPEDSTQQSMPYLVGVKAESLPDDLGPLVVKQIPLMRVARFVHRGSLMEQKITLDYAFHAWFPRSGEMLSRPWILETLSEDGWHSLDEVRETMLDIPIL